MNLNDVNFNAIDVYILDAIINENNYLKKIIEFVQKSCEGRGINKKWATTSFYSSIDKLTEHKIIVKVERTQHHLFLDINRLHEEDIKSFVKIYFRLNRIMCIK